MTYRSAYPAPIQPMDAHDRAFAKRNAPPKADKRGPWPFRLFRAHPHPKRGGEV